MKDIARDLGVSAMTISRVLRNRPDVGEATRKRVFARVRELDYRPNCVARSLSTGRSYLVGLVVPSLYHTFFAGIAKSLSDALEIADYSLVLASSDEDPDVEEETIEQLLPHRLDTLLIASCRSSVNPFLRIQSQRTPYVLIDRDLPGLSANFVGTDDEAAGLLATRHLIEIGCTRIAHIRGPEISTGNGRLEGYKRALALAGMRIRDDYIVTVSKADGDTTRECGAQAARQLLLLYPRPDGIFCFNDLLAIGAMHGLLNNKLRIPEDVALIGCGNLHYDDTLLVPLSSIDLRASQIASEAARITLESLNSTVPRKPERVVLKPGLVVRQSTQRRLGRLARPEKNPPEISIDMPEGNARRS